MKKIFILLAIIILTVGSVGATTVDPVNQPDNYSAVLYDNTNGLPTAENEEQFGTDRMIEALNKNQEAKPEEVLENVNSAVADFVKEAEQFDDMTMLCMEYHP